MTQSSSDRPPLTSIDASGVYVLRLCKPKPEKFKLNSAGFPFVSLFFTTADGKKLNKTYWTNYGTKPIAMLVGKFTNQYVQAPESYTIEQLQEVIELAANCVAEVDLEVSPALDQNGQQKIFNGDLQFNYKFKSIKSILGNSNGQPTLNADAPQVPDFTKPDSPF
jgi:hypothetical protein